MSIKSRLLLLILVAALPVFILYAWGEFESREQRREAAADQLMRSTRLLAAQQDQFFRSAESVLGSVLIAVSDNWRDTEMCNAYLVRLAGRNPVYTGIGVATPDGTVICSSAPGQMLGMNLAGREYFAEAMQTGEFAIGDVQAGEASGQAIVGVALPLRGENGEVKLMGVLGLDLTDLSDTISTAALPPKGVAVVFNGKGTILARSPDPERWVGKAETAKHVEIARTGGGVFQATGLDGLTRQWAVSPLLPQKEVYAALGVPEPTLQAEADRIFWQGMGLLFIVFGAAAVAAIMAGERTIRRPLESLEKTVARLRGGDLTARSTDVGSAPELVKLGQSFNEMAHSLQERGQELEQKNAELEQVAAERELLMREMNHRIKNSLQLVSALIGMQSAAIRDPATKSHLDEARARVMAVGKVHDRLYQNKQLGRVDAGQYLKELCRDLGETGALKSEGGEIACRAVQYNLSPDEVVPLGIITAELVTNAVRHAYGNGAGKVEVALEATDGGHRLSVSDAGGGVPEDFETREHAGLGMKVVQALAQQLGGELKVERLNPGTRFTLDLPPGQG